MLVSTLVTMLSLATYAMGTLTFTLGARERSCYYIFTTKPNVEISFYYAVQSGGATDVDYTITGPNGDVIAQEDKRSQGELLINGEKAGEYEFCFSNDMSTYHDKVIDFDIQFDEAGFNFKADLPNKPNQKPIEHVESMQATVERIGEQLEGLKKTLRYYKTRNNRNQATVKSTESRIYYFSIFEVLLMVGMAFLQITVVQLFFKGSRRQLV